MTTYKRSLVWFRRDLRIDDQTALWHALKDSEEVYGIFIFDPIFLKDLPSHDRRIAFIHGSLVEIDKHFQKFDSALLVEHGKSQDILIKLSKELKIDALYFNEDFEPMACQRDKDVQKIMQKLYIDCKTYQDQAIIDPKILFNLSKKPYTVYTPYFRAWQKIAIPQAIHAVETSVSTDETSHLEKIAEHEDAHNNKLAANLQKKTFKHLAKKSDQAALSKSHLPTLKQLGFADAVSPTPVGSAGAYQLLDDFLNRIKNYHIDRNYPARNGQSGLSMHLRHGTISIRAVARAAYAASLHAESREGAQTWISELAWRDFFFQILYHHPHLFKGSENRHHYSFKKPYDHIDWRTGKAAEKDLAAWCAGKTGYPIVDAAMRQLNETGFMHNRLRMITANFLCKDLGIDWRRGESYFEYQLNDFELSSNNGNWQWAASSGCDAQPFFRIFNPIEQSKKFDQKGEYIRKWVPELSHLSHTAIHAPWLANKNVLKKANVILGKDYPFPIVDHSQAREKTLTRYSVVKKKKAD